MNEDQEVEDRERSHQIWFEHPWNPNVTIEEEEEMVAEFKASIARIKEEAI